jgi:pentose-5-phosphate-3-epimerase
MPDQEEFIKTAKRYGQAGLALDGPTDIRNITIPLNSCETILFMGIKAGFSGQEFNSGYLSKIKEAKEKGFMGTSEVDGGINDMTIVKAKEKGATRFVSTSFLFASENPKLIFQNLSEK